MVHLVRQGAVRPHRRTDSAKTYVLTGYRPDLCYSPSAALCQMHNETINIWSHLVGSFFVGSYLLRFRVPMCALQSHVLDVHVASALVLGVCSTLFHIGESFAYEHYQALLKADTASVFVACVANANVIVAFELHPVDPQTALVLLATLVLLASIGACTFLFGTVSAHPVTMLILYVLPFVPIGIAWGIAFDTARNAFLASWVALLAATTIIWLTKFPEVCAPPGSCDLVGNSHNLMHVLTLVTWAWLHDEYGFVVGADFNGTLEC